MDELEVARACADKMYAADKASQALGIEIEIPEPGSAIATMRVRDDMVNGFDICHGGRRGGVYAVEVVNQQGEFVALFRGRAISRGQPVL